MNRLFITFGLVSMVFTNAQASAIALQSGVIEAEVDGQRITLPMLLTDTDVALHGDLATVHLSQTFTNPGTTSLDARYLFPMPENAAVYAMRFTVGDTVITGEIKEKGQAQAIYDEAKESGQQAALLTQHRPNVFTQDLANVPAGAVVKVEISYAHAVPHKDGAYEWVLPLSVGPRYVPANRVHAEDPEPLAMGTWNINTGVADKLPTSIAPGRFSMNLTLDGGAPVKWMNSGSHANLILGGTGQHRTATLSKTSATANRDVVIRYALVDDELAAGLTAQAHDGHGVISLLIEPPTATPAVRLTPREMVFVLDVSGSMGGEPLDAMKRFMSQVLTTLRPGDYFRIVVFSNDATSFSPKALPANAESIEQAAHFIRALHTQGGTEMRTGVHAALDAPPIPGTVRNVVFLTDGYIGNDADVIRLVQSQRGDARLFSFGVGGNVNRWLLEEMARVGQGVCRIVENTDSATAVADAFAERISAPYLTDVRIDWGDAPVREMTPAVLPDLYLGEPLRVMAKFDKPGQHTIRVHGKIAGAPATLPLTLTLPRDADRAESLPVIWARSQVEDQMASYLSPLTTPDQRLNIEQKVTTLGLEHHITTQWTSFVAVAKAPIATPATQHTSGQLSTGQNWTNPTAWGGNAAPEPAGWAAWLLMLGLGIRARWARDVKEI